MYACALAVCSVSLGPCTELDGREIRVDEATDRRPQRGGGGGGHRGGGDRY